MAAKNKLNILEVRNRKEPGRLGDGGGLYLNVARGGSKSWVLAWKSTKWITATNKSGRQEIGLGGFPAVSLSEARALRDEYQQLIKKGIHPREVIKAEKAKKEKEEKALQVNTFGAVAAQYLDLKRDGFRNQKHIAQWHKSVVDPDGYCAAIIHKPVAEIDQDDVLAVFNPLWADRPETARRVLGRIKSVITYAIASKTRTNANPAEWSVLQHVVTSKPNLIKRHHAAMDYVDVPTFFEQLQSSDAVAARALALTILTACRTSEALNAVWSEFDLGAGAWIIPAERMKNGNPHAIPLSDFAVDILNELQQARVNEFVFPGSKANRPLSNMAMLMLLRRHKINDVTVHGFRSAFRGWVFDKTEFSDKIAEIALAHSNPDKVEAAYLRSSAFLKRRQLMQAWCDYCLGKQSADVLQFGGKASNG